MRIHKTRIDKIRITCYYGRYKEGMPNANEAAEKMILANGWVFKSQEGSHRHYIHPSKPGKVTIPFHCKDLPKATENSIKRQAGLK